MSTKIKKTYCTVFKRSDGEKRQAQMIIELDETKRELAEVKALLNKLMDSKELEEGKIVSAPKSSRKKKETTEE